MIWHPLVWAFWAAAAAGGLLYAVGFWRALDVAVGWSPDQADPGQLRRERHAETAALLGRGAMVCLTAAATTGLIGIGLVWHRIVPGAMCGTGVLQAMGTAGLRAMLFWCVVIMVLYAWQSMDRLDDHNPLRVMVPMTARLLIAAAPFLVLALIYSWQALMRVDSAPPVSCCAAVYDQVLGSAAESGIAAGFASAALWFSLPGCLLLPAAVFVAAKRPPVRAAGALIAAMAIGWSVLAAISVKNVWSAYYYQVLSHPCPWCLFLPDYHGAGFLIFTCLAVVSLEGAAFWVADHTRRHYTELVEPAGRRQRLALRRIGVAVVAFALLVAVPALAWRLRTGVWMDGTM